MKIIDGITLLKMIKEGTITNKTKLNCVDWGVSSSNNKVYVNSRGMVKWEVSNVDLTQEMLIKYHFEILEDKEYEDIDIINGDYVVPNTPATENEAYIMACFLAHEQILNALIRNQKKIIEKINGGE